MKIRTNLVFAGAIVAGLALGLSGNLPWISDGQSTPETYLTLAPVAALLPPPREEPAPSEPRVVRTLTGSASFYASSLAGRRTASGVRYDPRAMVAAHRTLPFGTVVRVTNERNGRSVVVRVVDRGPFVRGRVIDLSRAAAEELDFIRRGHVNVTIEVLDEA
jgi:rare lipoprotein A